MFTLVGALMEICTAEDFGVGVELVEPPPQPARLIISANGRAAMRVSLIEFRATMMLRR